MQRGLDQLEELLKDQKSFIPQKPEKSFIRLSGIDYLIAELKLNKIPLIINSEEIIKIRLLIPIETKQESQDYKIKIKTNTPGLLYFRNIKGVRSSLPIASDQIEKFYPCYLNIERKTFAYLRNSSLALDWQNSLEYYYKENVYEYYEEMSKIIYKEIVEKMVSNRLNKINLIDMGCGNGSFLLNFISTNKNISWIGVDLNEENIKNAQKKAGDQKSRFIMDDMININSILKKSIEEKLLDQEAPVFVTTLGSMTRLVLPNGFIAAKIFQELYKIKNLLITIGCGVGEPLITYYAAKRMGFKLKNPPTQGGQFKLEKLDQKDIFLNKVNKIKKSKILDLSLSPIAIDWLQNPEIIEEIKNSKQPITIDVSYCQLDQEVLSTLMKIITMFEPGKIKLIYFNCDFSQVKLFQNYFIKFKNYVETFCFNENDDIRLLAPKGFFDVVNPYQALIQKIIKASPEMKELKDYTKKDIQLLHKELEILLQWADANEINIGFLFEKLKPYKSLKKIFQIYIELRESKIVLSPASYPIIYAANFSLELFKAIKMLCGSSIDNKFIIDFLLRNENFLAESCINVSKFWLALVSAGELDQKDFLNILPQLKPKELDKLPRLIKIIKPFNLKNVSRFIFDCRKLREEGLEIKKLYDEEISETDTEDEAGSDSSFEPSEKTRRGSTLNLSR